MRSPVIAFGIFAAAAVSPSLVSGAPASPNIGGASLLPHLPGGGRDSPAPALPHAPGLGRRDVGDVAAPPTINDDKNDHHKKHKHGKRAIDAGTAGGNAYSGGASNSSGGSVVNEGEDNEDDVIDNDMSNAAGIAGASETGDAEGGRGRGFGPGGNAYTGAPGRAQGGSVINEGGEITNMGGSNFAGEGNESTSGNADGGNALKKRATDDRTAGGNAYTGSTGDVGSGNVINEADGDATITNTGPGTNFGDLAGTSETGNAEGGRGDGKGPGGNAYTGFAGPTRGGNVINEGGSIDNTAIANAAGNGNDSESGEADGGDARR